MIFVEQQVEYAVDYFQFDNQYQIQKHVHFKILENLSIKTFEISQMKVIKWMFNDDL